jgi:hypothetical protein
MSSNPYAPPKAKVGRVAQVESAPALWNPDAAMKWSLLFSPVLGTLLHMKNWQAIGEPAKARAAAGWAVASLALLLGLVVLGVALPHAKALDGISRMSGLILLVVWYAVSGREQSRYIKERFGDSYPRKGWGKPLALAALAIFVFIGLIFAFFFVKIWMTGKV